MQLISVMKRFYANLFFLNFFYVEKTMNSHNGNICQNKKSYFKFKSESGIFLMHLCVGISSRRRPLSNFFSVSLFWLFVQIQLWNVLYTYFCVVLQLVLVLVLRDEFSCCQSFCICRPPKLSLGQPVWHELCSLIGTSYYQDAIEL